MSKFQITMSVDCDGNGTTVVSNEIPQAAPTETVAKADYRKNPRRRFSDEEVRSWVKDWRVKHLSFTDLEEKVGIAKNTIAYNVYRVTALDLLKENDKLKEDLSRCYKHSVSVAKKLAECESKKR